MIFGAKREKIVLHLEQMELELEDREKHSSRVGGRSRARLAE